MITKEELINQLYDLNNSVETGTFIDEDLSDTNLSRINLSKIIFKRCNFYVSSLCSCTFTECEFLDCNFQSANLLNVTFKDCNIVNNNFTAAKLQDVLIEGGFKTGNNFTSVNIVDNVKGLSQKDLSIIGDSIEGASIFSDKWTKNGEGQSEEMTITADNYTISFSKDEQMGQNVYRMTLFDENAEDSIASETITIEKDKKITEKDITELFNKIYQIAAGKCNKILQTLNKFKGQIKQSLNVESVQTEAAQVLSKPQTLLELINAVNKLSGRVADLQKKLNIFPEK